MLLVEKLDMLEFCFSPRSFAEMAATTSVHVVSIIELMINHSSWFFPEGETNIDRSFALNLH